MFGFFDGTRGKRAIDLSGAREDADRKEKIEKARRERMERARFERETAAAKKIQAMFRGRTRISVVRNDFRCGWDDRMKGLSTNVEVSALNEMLREFLFFYRRNGGPGLADYSRLDAMCSLLMRSFRSADPRFNFTFAALDDATRSAWLTRVNHLLRRCVWRVHDHSPSATEVLPTSLQMILCITDATKWAARPPAPAAADPAREEAINAICGMLFDAMVAAGLCVALRGCLLRTTTVSEDTAARAAVSPASQIGATVAATVALRQFRYPLRNATRAYGGLVSQILTIPLLHLRLSEPVYRTFVDARMFAGVVSAFAAEPTLPLAPEMLAVGGGPALPSSVYLLTNLLYLARPLLSKASSETIVAYVRTLRVLLDAVPESVFPKSSGRARGGAAAVDDDDDEGAGAPDVLLPDALRQGLDTLISEEHTRALCSALSLDPESLRGRVLPLPASLSPVKRAARRPITAGVAGGVVAMDIADAAPATDGDVSQRASEGVLHVCALGTVLMRRWSNARLDLLHTFAESTLLVPSLWALLRASGQLDRYAVEGSSDDSEWLVSILTFFCECLDHLLFTLDDEEFGNAERTGLTASDFVELSRVLKRMVFRMYWVGSGGFHGFADSIKSSAELHLRSVATKLVSQLHRRDARRPFCPPGHWEAEQIAADTFAEEFIVSEDREGSRCKAVLQNIPFVVPFSDRVQVWQHFLHADKMGQRDRDEFGMRMDRPITVRRTHIFEDGIEQLSYLRSALKGRIRVTFVDQYGMAEAGVDGGGLFKEFLTELVKTCCNPNYGIFCQTADHCLYPNPDATALLGPGVARSYLEFLGRILGKALYEGILVELPLAQFFLWKILGQTNFVNDLPSLDPELHANLLKLKTYEGDVSDHGLYFTVTVSDGAGGYHEEELFPGGASVAVTNENKVKYIYYIANYRLNEQLRLQSRWFLNGLADLIDPFLLRMFNPNGLQVLISGAITPVDVADWRRYTVYGGELDDDHPTVRAFWWAVERFNPEQTSKLLKFVTSCSRPPLLGFRELHPPFTIHGAGTDQTRLPTASTCMNLLKLPLYTDRNMLREKLLYAMEANTGFSLS